MKVADDEDFVDTIGVEKNPPEFVKHGIKKQQQELHFDRDAVIPMWRPPGL